MKTLLLLTVTLLATTAVAQDRSSDVPQKQVHNLYRLKIRHADPQLIYLLLTGRTNFNTPPEISSRGGGQ
jgi:uncharacterized protein YprB with RNaseH-like and TPR domain